MGAEGELVGLSAADAEQGRFFSRQLGHAILKCLGRMVVSVFEVQCSRAQAASAVEPVWHARAASI